MKISYLWLKELLPGLKATPQEVAHQLTNAGLEVEGVVPQGSGLGDVVIGLVEEKGKHPNADRLSFCKVTDGRQTYEVVCGASNVTFGKKYPFARIGARLPNGMEIKEATIRGVVSKGMLCSAKELGLSEESQGLLELGDDAPVGQKLIRYLGLDDVILDVAVPPNRGDCLSHIGVAKEVAALMGCRVQGAGYRGQGQKTPYPVPRTPYPIIKVKIQDKKGCRRYCAQVIQNIKVGPSPRWMVNRLRGLGVRSINNIVDATNTVMLETGHPLHAFDSQSLAGGQIFVRAAGTSQKFRSLDNCERELLPDDLVIADAAQPVALAGIMGGANSEIREKTTTIVLEAASFDPLRIRKTARRLSLQSESSTRFERGVPAETVREAIDRLTALILEVAGGEASRDEVDLYPRKEKQRSVFLRQERLNQIVGTVISSAVVARLLHSLGLNPKKQKNGWKTIIPPARIDLTREVDLIEEVVRLYGIDRLSSELPRVSMTPSFQSAEGSYEGAVKTFLADRGFFETIHLSFCSPADLEKCGFSSGEAVTLDNPLSQEASLLRTSLLPALLSTVVRNIRNGESSLRLFELRPVYSKPNIESWRLAGLCGGRWMGAHWKKIDREIDFFDGKGILEDLFRVAGLPPVQFGENPSISFLHPRQSVRLVMGEKELGVYGRLNPLLQERFELPFPFVYFDLDYSLLSSHWGKGFSGYRPYSPYPRIVRDLALVADRNLSSDSIVQAVKNFHPSGLASIQLFDVYEGEKLPQGKKSLAYTLIYENKERTLTDEEVNKAHFELVSKLGDKLGVQLR